MYDHDDVVWEKLTNIDKNAAQALTETKITNERLKRIEDSLAGKLDTGTFWKVVAGCCAFFLIIINYFHG